MSIVVTGIGAVTGSCDSTPFLKTKKLRKFMGKQDELAVVAAARAVAGRPLNPERTGLYMTVGYIPFEHEDIERLTNASRDGDRFSMERFAANAFEAVHPLLTFRVLPNMPAFHVSLNLDIQGPYAVTYPGIAQFYLAMEEAIAALDSDAIDVALLGAVADQRNLLVEEHFASHGIDPATLENAAAFLVLERNGPAKARLIESSIKYVPSMDDEPLLRYGPAQLGVALATATGTFTHSATTRDGFQISSTWELP